MELPSFRSETLYLQSTTPPSLSFICSTGLVFISPSGGNKAEEANQDFPVLTEPEEVPEKTCSPRKEEGGRQGQAHLRVRRGTNAKERRGGSKRENPLVDYKARQGPDVQGPPPLSSFFPLRHTPAQNQVLAAVWFGEYVSNLEATSTVYSLIKKQCS